MRMQTLLGIAYLCLVGLLAFVWLSLGLKAESPSWQATAYCKGEVTAAGIPVKRGMAASDPTVLPLGSIVRVLGTGDDRWDGIYSVHDTGPAIKGHILDLYMWSCYEALDFGRREIQIDVLRRGWMPNGKVTR